MTSVVAVTEPFSGGGASSTLLEYSTNDFEDAEPFYAGKVKANGTWLIVKLAATTGAIRYANTSNNPLVASYTMAWAGRTALVYGAFETLSGV